MDLLKYSIALEANDITSEVEDEKNNVLGSEGSPAEKIDSLDGALNKLDEVSEDDDLVDKHKDAPADKTSEDVDTLDNVDSEDTVEDELDGTEIDNQKESKASFMDRNKIKNNLIHMYSVVSGEIDVLTDSLNNTNNIDTIAVINDVLSHLRNVKEYSYKVITEEIASTPYEQLLEKYVSLLRIYEVSTEMLSLYFKNKAKDK